MSSGEDLREGDKVRVTFEGVVGFDGRITHEEQARNYFDKRGFTVELIERPDDPSKDLVGTVRLSHAGPAVKARDNDWHVVRRSDTPSVAWADRAVKNSRWPIIGTVPGTPAAEKAAADELSADTWQNPHQFEASYSGMVCGRMVMRDGGGDSCGQPADAPVHERELWAGDGTEEPPAHVKKVQDMHGCVVERQGAGWVWATGEWADRPKRAWASDSCGPYTEDRT